MANNKRLSLGQRINAWLDEPEGRQFKDGKWRFWFPLVIGLSLLNAILTAAIFGGDGEWQTYIGGIVLSVGALLAWICVGTLHYSDSTDERMARGVSALDSVTLIFVIAHFCFLLWVFGHVFTIKASEKQYEKEATAYNEKAAALSADNVKIAQAAADGEKARANAARLQNDTAYQLRKAAESGAPISAGRAVSQVGQSPSLLSAVTKVELTKPTAIKQSSAEFLMEWDWWVRMANFGELALTAITLIYIRNRSAKANGQSGLPVATGATLHSVATSAPLNATQQLRHNSGATKAAVATGARPLAVLREHLRQISASYPGRWFKADKIKGGVVIRFCERQQGREVTIAETRQSDKLLAAVDRQDFQGRLVDELKRQGFPL